MIHVPSGPIGCASAALGLWVGGRGENQTGKNFFALRCTCTRTYDIRHEGGGWFKNFEDREYGLLIRCVKCGEVEEGLKSS